MASHNARCSDEEFVNLFSLHGAAATAKILDTDVRCVQLRRRRLEASLDRPIHSPNRPDVIREAAGGYAQRLGLEIRDGVVIVGSDGHFWPGYIPTAHRGMVEVAKRVKDSLKAYIWNGDCLDGASVSRHPAIMWQHGEAPKLTEELAAADARSDEIRAVVGSDTQLIWTLGNHDSRFENVLANQVPQFANVQGMRLSDHFPHWTFCWSIWINDEVVIKHRFKGGVHATHNNTVNAGKTMITGHLHSLKVTPFSDYNGTRYGVDTGTMNDPYGPHTAYTEDNPLNHRSGFVVLTFKDGLLLWPEIASVVDENHIQFRGELIEVLNSPPPLRSTEWNTGSR